MERKIDKAFDETASILLGRQLGNVDTYSGWLGEHVPLPTPAASVVSKKEIWMAPPINFLGRKFDTRRIIDMDEMESVNKSPFGMEEMEGVENLGQLLEKFVSPIAYYCGNFRYGAGQDIEKCSGGGGGRTIYYSEDVFHNVKNVAFSHCVVNSQNIFGGHNVVKSGFGINIYNSNAIARGFEVDGCLSSSDIYFCHNSENLRDCMFCFNAKNLKYAIGNVEVGKEEYARVKKMVLAEIGERLEKDKKLKWDIYSIGARR